MAPHTTASVSAHLHGNVVDVELLALRSRHSELHILVGRVVLGLYPGPTLAGADHDTLLAVVAILHHAFHLDGSSGSIAINHRVVITGQCPLHGEGVATTQLNGVHGHIGYGSLVAQCGGYSTIDHTDSSCRDLGIDGLYQCTALVRHREGTLPVLLVNRQQDSFRSSNSHLSC